MIITLSQQLRLLGRNIEELNKHSLDGNLPTIKFTLENHRTITSSANELIGIDFERSNSNNWSRHLLRIVRNRDNVGF
jgi:hypothetical protein